MCIKTVQPSLKLSTTNQYQKIHDTIIKTDHIIIINKHLV